MVTAGEARRSALYEGTLEKKRRTGGWKKKFFVLTASHFIYFDSSEPAATSRSTMASFDILRVETLDADGTSRVFLLHLYRKKKEFRAPTTEERDAWVRALSSVAAFKLDGSKNDNSTASTLEIGGTSPPDQEEGIASDHCLKENCPAPPSTTDMIVAAVQSEQPPTRSTNSVDLAMICERMKRVFNNQIQTSKSFAARDVIDFVIKQTELNREQAIDVGQQLIDAKLIVPLKSHVFEELDSSSRFRFHDTVSQRQPKNHLNMRSRSIQELMGSCDFEPRKYAEDFLKKHSSDKIEQHCENLISQKEQTIEALKGEISANYSSFIRASTQTKTMENSVFQLKSLVLECKRSIQSLKEVPLDTSLSNRDAPRLELTTRKADEQAKRLILEEFIHDLEVSLHEHAYNDFAKLVLDYKHKIQQNPDYSSSDQKIRVNQLVEKFTRRLVEEFNASMQASERMHKKEDHLKYLIQLGEPALATEMCLQNYSVQIALQLRHVPSYGNQLNYVINLSRTFFTSLLVCYEDYEHSFRGQDSSHFISLTVWISAQLERFANEILCHIFFSDSSQPSHSTRSLQPSQLASQEHTQPRTSAIDLAEFKNVTKFVCNALRYVFYGSRQLELAGLPTAHCLAPCLVQGVLSFIKSYSASIRAASREEVKRERWEMARRTIRDAETKRDREIILTQSARSFYSMIQQFLRDAQRLLNPSCATSYIPDVQEAVVAHTDELIIRYSSDVLNYLETPKMSSSVRLKQVVGILTNVAYIQDDCAARSSAILHEFLPKAALKDRQLESQNPKLWRRLVVLGMQKAAQSLLKMSLSWHDLDLSEEILPDMTVAKEVKPLFVTTLMKELTDVSNSQLEKLLKNYRLYRDENKGNETEDGGDAGQIIFATMVLEGMLVEMMQDEAWWQHYRKGGNAKDSRRIGYAGLNKFIAELRVLTESPQTSKVVEEVSSVLVKMLVDVYSQSHPEKKEPEAPEVWTKGYIKMCMYQLELAASTFAATSTTPSKT